MAATATTLGAALRLRGRSTINHGAAHRPRSSAQSRRAVSGLALLASIGAQVSACGEPERRAPSDSARGAAAVGRVPASSAVAPVEPGSLGSGVIYTANEGGRSISRIDLASGRVATFPIGLSPHNVQISRDGRQLFAIGTVSGGMPDMGMPDSVSSAGGKAKDDARAGPGQLLILDAAATDTAAATRVTVGREPAHVILDAAGARAYTTSGAANAVLVVDVTRRRVIDTISTAASPHGLRMRPGGRELYVAATAGNAVSVLDVARQREVARIPAGRGPVQVGFLPDGAHLYVSLRDDNAVAVIDTKRRRVVARISVGRSPIQLFATPDGHSVYVANQGTEAQPDSTVSVIDTRRNAVVATLITGRGAHGVVVSDDGRRVFVANTFAGTVSVIDVAAQRVIGTVRVGAGPGGITYRAPSP